MEQVRLHSSLRHLPPPPPLPSYCLCPATWPPTPLDPLQNLRRSARLGLSDVHSVIRCQNEQERSQEGALPSLSYSLFISASSTSLRACSCCLSTLFSRSNTTFE